jgi:hypothetical protein
MPRHGKYECFSSSLRSRCSAGPSRPRSTDALPLGTRTYPRRFPSNIKIAIRVQEQLLRDSGGTFAEDIVNRTSEREKTVLTSWIRRLSCCITDVPCMPCGGLSKTSRSPRLWTIIFSGHYTKHGRIPKYSAYNGLARYTKV